MRPKKVRRILRRILHLKKKQKNIFCETLVSIKKKMDTTTSYAGALLPPLLYTTLAIISCIGCCSYLSKQKKMKNKIQKLNDFEKNQKEHPTFPLIIPGSNNAPIFTGVRVLELTTVVAGPSAGRCLADHGAEVVKIEAPDGDMWRKYLKIIEKKRKTFVSSFEHVNFNKSSVVLDLTSGPEAIEQLKELMSQADVFITNVRLPALQKLGLDYESVSACGVRCSRKQHLQRCTHVL